MKLTGTITKTREVKTEFTGDITVNMTIDRPADHKVQVTLSNNANLEISGADYDALSANWKTDDDLLTFIAAKFKLQIG